MESTDIEAAAKHFRQAKLRLRKAQDIISALMAQKWNNLKELQVLFRAIPACQIKSIILTRIHELELTQSKKRSTMSP